jgi:hypothetical protein
MHNSLFKFTLVLNSDFFSFFGTVDLRPPVRYIGDFSIRMFSA